MPKVSVIVPNFNHARFLQQRLDSIFNQTYQDFEVILLDDCSTDDSRTILEQYRDHSKVTTIVYNEQNSGSTFKQWNKGIGLSSGEYIWIAESDDWAEINFLEVLVDILNQNSSIGIAFCKSKWVDENSNIGKDLSLHKEDFLIEGEQEIVDALMYHNNIQNVSSALIRSEFLKNDIYFTHLKAIGDWIFYIDILSNSKLAFTKLELNNFRWYHNNVSNNSSKKRLWIVEGISVLMQGQKYFYIPFCKRRKISRVWLSRLINLTIHQFSFKHFQLYLHLAMFYFNFRLNER